MAYTLVCSMVLQMPQAVSLFSGCGGFCEGIELAGFDIKCAVEFDKYAASTYRFNFPDTPLFEQDIHNFLGANSQAHTEKFGLRDIDLIFGGPPCQGFSQIGTRSLEDERNQLFLQFTRVLSEVQPSVFLMENVPNLLLLRQGYYRDLILEAIRSSGYHNSTFLQVIASDYGVPQERRRVFFIGIHDRYKIPFDLHHFVEVILSDMRISRPVTVWEAIGDLPTEVVQSGEVTYYPKEAYSEYQRVMRLDFNELPYTIKKKRERGIQHFPELHLHNHHTKEIQERRSELIKMLAPGKKADSLPKDIWNGKRPEKWRRLHPNQPAYTLLANMHRDLSEFVHPQLNRWITVREAARLQSFHDGFVFVGSEWQQLKQIGNAVPPLLGRAMGIVALELLAIVEPNRVLHIQNNTTSSPQSRLVQQALPFV